MNSCWKEKIVLVTLLAVVLGFSNLAHANLVDNGGGLIYDTDRNITWYDAPAVLRTWDGAMSWATGLNVGGVTGWRLPSTLPVNGGNSYNITVTVNGSTDRSYNITSPNSEMAYLFYVELGNKGLYDSEGRPQTGYGLRAGGPFVNINNGGVTWSSSVYQPDNRAFGFGFEIGMQVVIEKNNQAFASLAVHDGNIGGASPVPIPPTVWLLGSGLIGLVGLKRMFRIRSKRR
ncbi:MAG: hypothetical protein C0392_11590 [Syntrophus sp. (in: bacteria)]|nr:hypothetical protein [Syntrophus sp. (in: bacteria)]